LEEVVRGLLEKKKREKKNIFKRRAPLQKESRNEVDFKRKGRRKRSKHSPERAGKKKFTEGRQRNPKGKYEPARNLGEGGEARESWKRMERGPEGKTNERKIRGVSQKERGPQIRIRSEKGDEGKGTRGPCRHACKGKKKRLINGSANTHEVTLRGIHCFQVISGGRGVREGEEKPFDYCSQHSLYKKTLQPTERKKTEKDAVREGKRNEARLLWTKMAQRKEGKDNTLDFPRTAVSRKNLGEQPTVEVERRGTKTKGGGTFRGKLNRRKRGKSQARGGGQSRLENEANSERGKTDRK